MRLRRREQGAVAIFLSLVICFVMVPLAALAVDLGSQRVARRDAQAVADTVALDMARTLGGGTTPTDAMAQARAATISGVAGSAPTVHVYTGYIADGATFLSNQSLGCDGTTTNGYFATPPAGTSPNAVLVAVTGSVPFSFHSGSGGVCRSAIAATSPTACYKLGSWAAAVKLGDTAMPSQLNDIFGFNPNQVSLASYQGLAGASVTLAQLAATAQFGTPTALLTGTTTFSRLLAATVSALNTQNNPANAAAISTLGGFATVGQTTPAFSLFDVVGVDPSDTAALAMKVNVLDLLTSSMLVADQNHAVYIPNLWANVAGTGNTVGSTLAITEGAVRRCGRPNTEQSHATTAQVAGAISFDLINTSSLNLGSGNTVQTGQATGSLDVNVAKADAQLVDPPLIHCSTGSGDPTTFSVNVTGGLASAGLTIHVPVSGSVKLAYLSALGIPLGTITVALNLTVDITATVTSGTTSGRADLSLPPNDTTPVAVGGSPLRLSGVALVPSVSSSGFSATVTAGLLGIINAGATLSAGDASLASTLSAITTKLTSTSDTSSFASKTFVPLTANIDSGVLGPLSKGLGLRVGGADVYGVGADCATPALKG